MLLTTKGSLSFLHTLKHIIQGGVSTRTLVGEMREAHTTCQTTNYPNQGFSNQAPLFQSQGPQGFPVNPNQGFHPSNQGNPNPQPYQPPHKRSLEDIVTQFVQTQQFTNTEFRTALNDVRSQITKITSSMGNFQQEKGKLPSQTIQNPQGQNSVGVSSPCDGTFEHCKTITTLRSGKVIDKTIQPKEPIQDLKKMNQSGMIRCLTSLMFLGQMLLMVSQNKTRPPISLLLHTLID